VVYVISGVDANGYSAPQTETIQLYQSGQLQSVSYSSLTFALLLFTSGTLVFNPPGFGYLYAGENAIFTMGVSILPTSDVELVPSCAGLTFSSIIFTNGGSNPVSFLVAASGGI